MIKDNTTISRQAVIDLIVANHIELNGLNVVMYAPFYKDIIQLPPIKSQPKMGQWIKDTCSICNYGVQPWNNTPYCPNCGAKMEVKE